VNALPEGLRPYRFYSHRVAMEKNITERLIDLPQQGW
jgi:hypothetical protein